MDLYFVELNKDEYLSNTKNITKDFYEAHLFVSERAARRGLSNKRKKDNKPYLDSKIGRVSIVSKNNDYVFKN